MRRAAALIVGGGPAGSAAGIALARAGISAELIDRSAGPRDVVCGGFVGWDSLAALGRLGIDAAALGARPIGRLRLISGRDILEARLPSPAAGLSRRRLDSALLDAAEGAGVRVSRGRTARAAEGPRCVRLEDGEEIEAEALFLATGKHELRGLARPLEGRIGEPAAGLRTALPVGPDLARALGGFIELHLFDEGYAGLLLQEDGSANLCLSISRRRLGAARGPEGLIEELMKEAPLLAERIGGAAPETWEAVAGVPYGWRAQATGPGQFRIGDQAAVIASLAGDGIAIALTSGIAAAEAMSSGGPGAAPAFQREFARRAARPVAVAERLRRSAESRRRRAFLLRLLKGLPMLVPLAARLTRIG
ncbi:NAD(P)/FAD-dependent oxidoreductase [Allosphingosinicella sp.]|uniref:NAD(P)/FAD-dependent oxidoreductase n=1 Tax=Allosphingosinicella sp. TaxID=2823234 RepID=UPI002EEAFE9A